MNNKLLLVTFSSLFILSGCFNGSNKNDQATQNSVGTLSNSPADSDATALNEATLKSDLNTLFGDADGEPIPVEDNDSVQDVIDRSGS